MEKPEQQLDRRFLDRPLTLAPIQPSALGAPQACLLDHRQPAQDKLARKHDDHLPLAGCECLPPSCLHLAICKRSQRCINPVQAFLHAA